MPAKSCRHYKTIECKKENIPAKYCFEPTFETGEMRCKFYQHKDWGKGVRMPHYIKTNGDPVLHSFKSVSQPDEPKG